MGQSGKVDNAAAPPFATKDGKTVSAGSDKGGDHDFLTDPKGSGPATGGRDFNKESRPQTEARDENSPNPQEIPKGGKILFADPGPVSAKVSGTAQHVEKKPFKL